MNIIDATPELASVLSGADHIDVKTAESAATLREFVAGAMGWQPGWMRALFRARTVLAKFLRLRDSYVPVGRPAATTRGDLFQPRRQSRLLHRH
ncbi:DUF2867 domain-containing protein [Streptomyces sp. NPDC053792]|uniref:DUF2867 domain-containing protein n=1 Tax=Streptomyces sp. NPDC053792 TaxID=3365716 RepID=UPI0037CCDB66